MTNKEVAEKTKELVDNYQFTTVSMITKRDRCSDQKSRNWLNDKTKWSALKIEGKFFYININEKEYFNKIMDMFSCGELTTVSKMRFDINMSGSHCREILNNSNVWEAVPIDGRNIYIKK
ncbi:MAG: hypothetical protein RR513_06510 [Muribaculaceae bacterium]